MEKIYIRLLNEGTDVYRPVSATKLSANTYLLGGEDIFDPDDEEWEFLPGTHVIVQSENLYEGPALVAVGIASNIP